MIQITPQMRILLAVEPVDSRKGIDGLAAVCRASPLTEMEPLVLSKTDPPDGMCVRRVSFPSWGVRGIPSRGFRLAAPGRVFRAGSRGTRAEGMKSRARRIRTGIQGPRRRTSFQSLREGRSRRMEG